MQTAGKIIEKLPEVSGENEHGYWVRGGFVLMTADDRSETLAFEVNGTERAQLIRELKIGEIIMVEWRPNSRKYEDKWFTSLRCYGIIRLADTKRKEATNA